MKNLRTQTDRHLNIENALSKAEYLFEKAIEKANDGKILQAMDIARDALIFSKTKNLYLAIYIHSFMAALSMDFKQFGNARLHIYNAVNRLNKNHFSYNIDRAYLEALLLKVNNLDKEYKQLEFDVAA